MKALTAKNKSRIYQGKSAPLAACLYIGLVLCCVVFADLLPLPFSPVQLDLANRYLPPFQWQTYSAQQPFHWFGTDHLGRDVLANMVYGCRTAFLLSIPAYGYCYHGGVAVRWNSRILWQQNYQGQYGWLCC
jgi:peptide/nickel transport system permease protein